MRIALLTLEALANARAVRRFVAAHAKDIALVGLSDPFRKEAGGSFGQTWKRVKVSGPGIVPYLFVNFSLPRIAGALPGRTGSDVARVPLAKACRERGIPSVTVSDVNGPDFRNKLAESGADLILSFHFDQILSPETITAVPLGGINVHPSLLPRHRGPVPTIHSLLQDPVRLGVSVHRLVPKIDAGSLLAQASVPDRPGLSAIGAASRLHEAALPLLDRLLPAIARGDVAETPLSIEPYEGFPTPAQLRTLRRRGRAAASWTDIRSALSTKV